MIYYRIAFFWGFFVLVGRCFSLPFIVVPQRGSTQQIIATTDGRTDVACVYAVMYHAACTLSTCTHMRVRKASNLLIALLNLEIAQQMLAAPYWAMFADGLRYALAFAPPGNKIPNVTGLNNQGSLETFCLIPRSGIALCVRPFTILLLRCAWLSWRNRWLTRV